ncbi:lipopolysaccharide kinase InaA family protein [Spartinivicinus ruber]|uniref:lipopolysaccharide kinase InaA family protein n=1 Tax=Spartinivicinus ruber TaxID=2683272 RepID=UPI0013D8D895|nr:lipopolysaccharide kinase InaA family protein [Spartinivicinus ruber]
MMFETFATPSLQKLFQHNQLDKFELIWSLTTDWFEKPNYRRNGWSGVIQYHLQPDVHLETTNNAATANGCQENNLSPLLVFIKRQENHNTRSLSHPFHGEPTFLREYKNICKLQQLQLPTLSPVYFGERRQANQHQAILITKALVNHINLFEWYKKSPTVIERQRVIQHIADWIIQLHRHRLCHYCLYPNHIFVSLDPNDPQPIKVIDLEKLRYLPSKRWRAYKDLKCFLRHSSALPKQDKNQLLDVYFSHYPKLMKVKQKLTEDLGHL